MKNLISLRGVEYKKQAIVIIILSTYEEQNIFMGPRPERKGMKESKERERNSLIRMLIPLSRHREIHKES